MRLIHKFNRLLLFLFSVLFISVLLVGCTSKDNSGTSSEECSSVYASQESGAAQDNCSSGAVSSDVKSAGSGEESSSGSQVNSFQNAVLQSIVGDLNSAGNAMSSLDQADSSDLDMPSS